jgi:hypothetical protein
MDREEAFADVAVFSYESDDKNIYSYVFAGGEALE